MMRLPLYPPARPQSIGEVLDTGFRVFRATIGHCLPYGALLVIAGQLGNFYYLFTGRLPPTAGSYGPGWWIGYAVGLVLTLLLWSALLIRQDALATRGVSSTGAELRVSLGRLPHVLALTLLASAGIAVGLLLLVAPGLYLAVALAFGTPILLLRREGGAVSALAGSARLVRGHWWRTALLITLAVLMMLAAYGVLATILTAASIAVAGIADRALIVSLSGIAGVVAGSFTAPFGSAMILAILGDLSRRAELRRAGDDTAAGAPAAENR